MSDRRAIRRGGVRWIGAATVFVAASVARGQTVTAPDAFIGHPVGADYKLAKWDRIVAYFRHVAAASDRVVVRDVGTTTEGRPMILAEISSAESMRFLARHRAEQHRVSDPRGIEGEDEERRLIAESKPVILVNCNLHSTEIASSQMALELLYDLATGDAAQVREILDRIIVLLVPSANPDGTDMVIDWYERSLGEPWEASGMPWLYQKYAGHDNNRDWYMLALRETRALTRVIYKEWLPTVVYDVHQMGNRGARLFVPPFHDPVNPRVPPVINQTLLIIGGHMAESLATSGKQGVVTGAMYDNWWAGGFRTTVYRHNMVGILTEAASVNIASPIFQRRRDLRGARRGMPSYELATNFPDPWPGGWWRLRDIVEYEKTACMALFTLVARYHEMFQGNYLRLGKEAVTKGKTEPPYAYLVPPDQRDRRNAAEMLERLEATAIEVHQADASFEADGTTYPAGTFILYCAQPYRNHLLDMMERQVYPDRVQFPGGPAEAPYDMAGWTLPLQMGVRRVAVARAFTARAHKLERIPFPEPAVSGKADAAHYLVVAGANDDYRLINRLGRKEIGVTIYDGSAPWKTDDGSDVPPGSIVIGDTDKLRAAKAELTKGLGLTLIGLDAIPETVAPALRAAPTPRLGLYQPWTASIDEGWTRLVLETFEFPYTSVHNADIRAGNLAERYDCLVFPSISPESILEGRSPDTTAPEYVGGIGPDGVLRLQEFVEAGGTLVCIDAACNLAIDHFNLPVRNVVRGLESEDFYCPGSILRVSIDPKHPLGYGLPPWVSASFRRSQAFALVAAPTAESKKSESADDGRRDPAKRFPTTVVGRYSDTILLESGWIRGGERIMDRPAVVEVAYGTGRVILLGFRVQNRAQSHGTFRLLFNAIQRSTLAVRAE